MKLIPSLNTLPSGAFVTETGITQPRTCAVIPNKTTDDEGFIDTRNVLPGIDRQVFVSVTAAREMGRLIGMYDAQEVDELRELLAKAQERLAEYEQHAAALDKYIEAERELKEATS